MLVSFRRRGRRVASAVGTIRAAFALLIACAPGVAHANERLRLTLDQAQAFAISSNPGLRKAGADLDAAQAAADEARAPLPANPLLTGDLGRRRAEGQAGHDWSIGIAQEIEIGGQPRLRREAFALALDASRQSVEESRRALAAEVERRFLRVLSLQLRRQVESEAMALVEQSTELVRKRHAAGEGTRLDTNLAEVEAGRFRNQVAQLGEQLAEARAALAQLLQLVPGAVPEAIGELAAKPVPALSDALVEGVAARPMLRSLSLREQTALRRLDLERASRTPNLTVGITTGQEAVGIASESVTTLSVSVPLPLFKRNQAAIAQAASDLVRAQADYQAGLRDARADVRALWSRVQSLERRASMLEKDILPRLEENLRLSRKALAAGETTLPEILLVNRQAMDTRRDIHETLLEHELARIDLLQAAGLTGTRP
jgi:cobalt-zinc-cadmium efflux system outer membrane protein